MSADERKISGAKESKEANRVQVGTCSLPLDPFKDVLCEPSKSTGAAAAPSSLLPQVWYLPLPRNILFLPAHELKYKNRHHFKSHPHS